MTRRRGAALLLLAIAASLALFSPSLANRFAMDDRYLAKAVHDNGEPNPMVRELQPLSRYFRSHYWEGSTPADVLYRPVTILSFALTYRLTGRPEGSESREAFPHHGINLLLHGAAVWCAYRLLRPLAARGPSLVGSLAFGAHALHSEVVAGIVGRAELLAFCGGAGAALLWRTARRARGAKRAARGAASAFLLFLAFCSKESALAWAPFLVVYDAAILFRRGDAGGLFAALKASVLGPVLVSALPIAAFFLLRAQMLSTLPFEPTHSYLTNPLAHAPPLIRVCTAAAVWALALWKTLAPVHLASDYSHAVFSLIDAPWDLRAVAAFGALFGLFAAGLVAAKRHPLVLCASAAFLGFALLPSNFLFATGTIFGERLCYAPSMGLSFALAWAAGRLPRSLVRPAAVAMGAWIALSCSVAWPRNFAWKDDSTLFLNDVEAQPDSARLHYLAAKVHERNGDRARAAAHLQRAVAIHPEYGAAWGDLGAIFGQDGNFEAAGGALERGLASSDVTPDARFLLHANLAALRAQEGRPKDAAIHLALASRLDPVRAVDRVVRLVEGLVASGERDRALEVLGWLARDSGLPPPVRDEVERLGSRLRAGG